MLPEDRAEHGAALLRPRPVRNTPAVGRTSVFAVSLARQALIAERIRRA
jgi:hypothetical protein